MTEFDVVKWGSRVAIGLVIIFAIVLFATDIIENKFNEYMDPYYPEKTTERFEVIEYDLIKGIVIYVEEEEINRLPYASTWDNIEVNIIESNETYLEKTTKGAYRRYDFYINLSEEKEQSHD